MIEIPRLWRLFLRSHTRKCIWCSLFFVWLTCFAPLAATGQAAADEACGEYGTSVVFADSPAAAAKEAFKFRTPTCSIKAQSDAYFRMLERQPQLKEVFKLGNHVVWITPSGAGLVIDTADGKEQMSDREIDSLFSK